MIDMRRTALFAALAPLVAPAAWGLGLGDITLRSYLNEPLRAEVELLDLQGLSADEIRIRLATQDDFDRMGVDRAYFLTSIDFSVETDADGTGKIVLTTTEPLLEPYLDIIIETRWPSGRLLREYTVLVDLPDNLDAALMASSANPRQAAAAADADAGAPAESTEPDRPRPARRYDRDAGPQPVAGGQYLVEKNDTLWEIAEQARPAGASIEQAMLATLELNPRAFNGGNINGLKAGYVIYLPDSADIRLSDSDAETEVAQQLDDWRRGIRREPALRVVADNEVDEGGDGEPVAAAGDSATDATEFNADAATGAMTDSPVAGTTPADTSPVADEAAVPAADLEAISLRLGELSAQVDSLRELVTLKDQQIAALQAELEARDQAAELAPASPAVAAPAVTPGPQAATPAPQAAAPASAPPAPANSGMPWWVYAIPAVLAVLAGGFLLARRRNTTTVAETVAAATRPGKRAEAPTPKASRTAVKPGAAPQPDPIDEMEEGGERGYGKDLHNAYAQENPVADAVAEADIYIAYGRYQQALDLLANAVKTDPSQANGLVKMVEVHLKLDQGDQAGALLGDIRATGDAEALARAQALIDAAADAPNTGGLSLEDFDDTASDTPADNHAEKPATTPQAIPGEAGLDFEMVAPDPDPAVSDGDTTGSATRPETAPVEPPSLELDLSSEWAKPADDIDWDDEDVTETGPIPTPADADEPAPTPADEPAPPADGPRKLPPELAAVLGTDVAPDDADDDGSEDDEDITVRSPAKGEDLVVANEANAAESKLDLARAYLDMGDDDGARPVLEEVLAEGDLQQQAEARELLLRIE